MATLSLSVGSLVKNLTIAQADISRWLEAYRARFNLPPEATQAQIFDAMATWLLVDVANNYVVYHEQQEAAKDAAENVPPIPLAPA